MRKALGWISLLIFTLLLVNVRGQQTLSPVTPDSLNDPFQWLEDNDSSRTWEWRLARTDATRKELEGYKDFRNFETRANVSIYSNDRIPDLEKWGDYYYGFWWDNAYRGGALRRTTLEELRKPEPNWEIVFDADRGNRFHPLAVGFEDMTCLEPAFDRCLFFFSPTGSDATLAWEYDLKNQRFVKDGFALPEARGSAVWSDADTLLVARTDDTHITTSGYQSRVVEWKRGTKLEAARTVLEIAKNDLGVWAYTLVTGTQKYEVLQRALTFYASEFSVRRGESFVKLEVPVDAEIDLFQDNLLVSLQTEWKTGSQTYAAGSLLAIKLEKFLLGDRDFQTLFSPSKSAFLRSWSLTAGHVILNILDNVRSRLSTVSLEGGTVTKREMTVPFEGNYSVRSASPVGGESFFLVAENYLTPKTWFLGEVGDPLTPLRQRSAAFDASKLEETRFEAVSRDGTRVPYTVVAAKDAPLNGKNPTLLAGYGGFNVSLVPTYNPEVGALWLERGGVYVVANIRGGGELGPTWHQAALRSNRQRAFDDFIAVAEDLIARKITSPPHLGIRGGSNGGLLVGAVAMQRPELFSAVVCSVPLLDMRRYTKLSVGSSWIDEYGDPDKPEDWAFLGKYSPYHNVSAQQKYPPMLLTTSSRDDRVHPAHARKMAALMESLGHKVLFYETYVGGHSGGGGYESALQFSYLWQQLK